MERHTDNVQNLLGDAVSGVTVTVRLTDLGTLASIFSDDLASPTVKANPFTNDADGEFFFYALNDTYDIELSGPVAETRLSVELFDPANALIRGPVLVGDTAGPTDIALGEVILADVGSNAVALTLPLDPGTNVQFPPIVVQHLAGDIAANNITIDRNGELIGGVAADITLTTPNASVILTWGGSAFGWAIRNFEPEVLIDVVTGSDINLPDATLVNVLAVDVQVSGIYALDAKLLLTVPAADDFQFDFTTPGADAIDGLVNGVTNGLALFDESAAEVVLTSGSLESVDVSAIVVLAAGAGTIQMRAAKNADAGADGTFHIGSNLKLRRLDV